MKDKYKKLIEDWCKKCNYIYPIGYNIDYLTNSHEYVITIYTQSPGRLIGKAGKDYNDFINELKKEFNIKYTVKFVEVDEFVNI